MALKTRKPTGRVPWPLILVEGGEKAGKSWMAAELSASARVGRTLWVDLGEGAGDEYGAIPGTRYEIVEHDGTWDSILAAVVDARDEARRAEGAGDPPVALVIDSMTLVWDMLKDWASNRARKAPSNQRLLKADPNAEINVSANFWNDANARHRKLMTILMTFPGIVVVTARGKEVTAMTNGQPDPKKPKEYRVEGHKDLGFDATAWVRLSRTDNPQIVGCRSVHAGIQPGNDKARTVPGLTLDRLIFDVLKCSPGEAHVRDLVELKAGDEAPAGIVPERAPAQPAVRQQERPKPSARSVEIFAAVGNASSIDVLKAAFDRIAPSLVEGSLTQAEADQLSAHVRNRKVELEKAAQATSHAVEPSYPPEVRQRRMKHMHAMWRDLDLSGDPNRDARLVQTSEVVGRPVESSTDLTDAELDAVIAWQETQRRERQGVATA